MFCNDKFYYLSYTIPIFQYWYLYLQYFLNIVSYYIDTIKNFTNTGILQKKKRFTANFHWKWYLENLTLKVHMYECS